MCCTNWHGPVIRISRVTLFCPNDTIQKAQCTENWEDDSQDLLWNRKYCAFWFRFMWNLLDLGSVLDNVTAQIWGLRGVLFVRSLEQVQRRSKRSGSLRGVLFVRSLEPHIHPTLDLSGLRGVLFVRSLERNWEFIGNISRLRGVLFVRSLEPKRLFSATALVWEVCCLLGLSNLTTMGVRLAAVWEVCCLLGLSNSSLTQKHLESVWEVCCLLGLSNISERIKSRLFVWEVCCLLGLSNCVKPSMALTSFERCVVC